MASGLAAACSKTILAPFDTIKTMQQQSVHGGKALGIVEAAKLIMARPKGFLELYVRFPFRVFSFEEVKRLQTSPFSFSLMV